MASQDQRPALRDPHDHAARVRDARAAAGLSQRQLAKRTGIPRKTVAAIERGEAVPSDDDLHVLAETLGSPTGGTVDPALEGVLREYLAMIIELRATSPDRIRSLRIEDLRILATALGDTPDNVEAQLRRRLGTLSDVSAQPLADPRCA
ncbi:MAG: helix-turn-helix transcriptional regulator [Acidimicrobiia bacterium]